MPDVAKPAGGSDIDNAARAALAHADGGLLHTKKSAFQIDVDYRVPVRFGEFMQHGVAIDSGVIHQNIYRAKRLFGLGKQRFNLCFFSDIAVDKQRLCARFAQGSGGGFAVRIAIGDNHSRAFPRKHLGNAKADTARGAGDNGGFTGKFHSNVPYESEEEFRDRCCARPQGGGANKRLSKT